VLVQSQNSNSSLLEHCHRHSACSSTATNRAAAPLLHTAPARTRSYAIHATLKIQPTCTPVSLLSHDAPEPPPRQQVPGHVDTAASPHSQPVQLGRALSQGCMQNSSYTTSLRLHNAKDSKSTNTASLAAEDICHLCNYKQLSNASMHGTTQWSPNACRAVTLLHTSHNQKHPQPDSQQQPACLCINNALLHNLCQQLSRYMPTASTPSCTGFATNDKHNPKHGEGWHG